MNPVHAKICLVPQKLGLGGPASFQAGLIEFMRRRGVTVCHDPRDHDLSAILVFGAAPKLEGVMKAQRAGIRVVQRLNGMNWVHRKRYTGIRHFLKAEYGNWKLRTLRQHADKIVYQSKFAREWWQREQGDIKKPEFIIHNGVDLALFSPVPQDLPADRYRILMVEGHHGGGYDQGLFTAAHMLRQLGSIADRPCELVVAGDVPQVLRQKIEKTGVSVHWLGVVSRQEVPVIDRSAHLLFSGDVNAACPNAVIEAMSCGLPVIAYNTGALPELVNTQAGKIALYGGDVWNLDPPDIESLTNAAWQVLLYRDELSQGARQYAERHFDMERIAAAYLDVLLGD